MNASTFNNDPLENTALPWLLLCTCGQQKCYCNAKFKPDLLCVKGLPYELPPPTKPNDNLIIQFIEFTYCSDRIPNEAVIKKYIYI